MFHNNIRKTPLSLYIIITTYIELDMCGNMGFIMIIDSPQKIHVRPRPNQTT